MSDTQSPWIKDVTDATFEQDVFEASKERPVVVDFWAEWCQPCLMLKPVLEQAAIERDGEFLLAKCNTSEVPKFAAQFQVQGIPIVFAVMGGEVVDYFQGMMPPDAVSQWLDQLGLIGKLQDAERLIESDPAAAEDLFRDFLDTQEDLAPARIGLARALLAQGEEEECRLQLQRLENRGFLEPEAEALKAELNLRGHQGDDLDALKQQAAADPENLEARVALGEALAAQGQHRASLEALLTVVEQDRAGAGETAREKMLDVFKILGDDNGLTREYRRRLSAALY